MLLFVLKQEVLHARLHLQFARGVAKASSDKLDLLHTAPTFFALTFRSHTESAYTRAARVFDPKDRTATVPSMVRIAETKAGTFKFATPSELREKVRRWENGSRAFGQF